MGYLPMFKSILLNTSFIILFNLVFAQTVSIPSDYVSLLPWRKKTQSLSTILQRVERPIFTCQQYKALSQQDTQIFSTKDFLVNHPFYSLFHMIQHTRHCFGLPKYLKTESRFPLEEGCVRNQIFRSKKIPFTYSSRNLS